ncbi:MAG: hypothetical protein M1833_005595 [Piccolia ochrophora]|nr:MAG: hypothetical protein M1833_005595 [Piccolia ochrophora]
MRLQLCVRRNQLPHTSIVWAVEDPFNVASALRTSATGTIAHLLECVNNVVPLEAADWGLEDYVVQLQGHECLHFYELGSLLRDGDQVDIRPLSSAELRSRRASGRHQISAAGIHLIDGVPFGKSYSARIAPRPVVQIPPRKHRKVLRDDDEGIAVDPVEDERLLLGIQEADTEDEEDKDYDPEQEASSVSEHSASEEGDLSNASVSDMDRPEDAKSGEARSPGLSPVGTNSLMSLDEEHHDSVVAADEQQILKSTDSTSKTVSADNSSSLPDEHGSEGRSHSTDGSVTAVNWSGDAEANNSSQYADASVVRARAEARIVPPGEGKMATRARNQRRRAQKHLKRLKQLGLIPKNATTADLAKRGTEEAEMESRMNATSAINDAALEDRVKEFLGQDAKEDSENAAEKVVEVVEAQPTGFEQKRQELLQEISSGGVELEPLQGKPRHDASPLGKGRGLLARDASKEKTLGDNPQSMAPSASSTGSRLRLDVASSRRMLLASLGLRVPKTKEEEETLRNRREKPLQTLAPGSGARKHIRFNDDGAAIPGGDTLKGITTSANVPDDESWKAKIHLAAVECCGNRNDLSIPPFPFVQRWDREQGKKRKRNDLKYYEPRQSNHDRNAQPECYDEATEESEMRPRKATRMMDSDEIDDAVNNQLVRDSKGMLVAEPWETSEETDLPAMPVDPSTCLSLQSTDLRVGMVVGFKRLVISSDWQPQLSNFQTASVDAINDDGTFQLTLAKRDRIVDENYDEKTGERLYGKFEVADADADEQARDGFLEVSFIELTDPRLVKAPLEATGSSAVETKVHIKKEEDVLPSREGSRNGYTQSSSSTTIGNDGPESDHVMGKKHVRFESPVKGSTTRMEDDGTLSSPESDSSASSV